MKKKNKHRNVVFKPYQQNQSTFLPPNLDDLIPKNHLVRLINRIIEQMNIDYLLRGYKGGGTSSYHPRMLLKVLIYGYTQRIYSSRRIARRPFGKIFISCGYREAIVLISVRSTAFVPRD